VSARLVGAGAGGPVCDPASLPDPRVAVFVREADHDRARARLADLMADAA